MFNNVINRHDIANGLRKLATGRGGALMAAMWKRPETRVVDAWSREETPPCDWWCIPEVQRRWNRMISGDPEVDYIEHVRRTCLAGRSGLRGWSIGCGTGHVERAWAATGLFRELEGTDVTEGSIRAARRAAEQAGLADVLRYRVDDVAAMSLPAGGYDVVLGVHSLHHLTPLAALFPRFRDALAPDGWFIINEFVGPDRFQWTDQQLGAINDVLSRMPPRLKTLWKSEAIKRPLHRPGRLAMILRDPSEAVESSRILPELRRHFDVREVRGYGGAILHMLLAGIAHHFTGDDPEAAHWLSICFETEDRLLAEGLIQHDFVVAVARR